MKIGKGKNTKPHPLRKSGKKAARKAQRRAEAEARQAAYNALTEDEKLIRRNRFRDQYMTQKDEQS